MPLCSVLFLSFYFSMTVCKRYITHLEGSCSTQWLTNLHLGQQYLQYCDKYEDNNAENLEGFSCWKFTVFVSTVVKRKITWLPKWISYIVTALKINIPKIATYCKPCQKKVCSSPSVLTQGNRNSYLWTPAEF